MSILSPVTSPSVELSSYKDQHFKVSLFHMAKYLHTAECLILIGFIARVHNIFMVFNVLKKPENQGNL